MRTKKGAGSWNDVRKYFIVHKYEANYNLKVLVGRDCEIFPNAEIFAVLCFYSC